MCCFACKQFAYLDARCRLLLPWVVMTWLALSPPIDVDNARLAAAAYDAPYDLANAPLAVYPLLRLQICLPALRLTYLLIPIIDLLMLRISRYQRKVPRRELLPLLPSFAHHRPVAREGEHDCILLAVVVYGRGAVGFGNHARGADVWCEADESGLPDHALGLAA